MPAMSQGEVILGIDPGTNVMGYAILGETRGKPALVAMGVLKLSRYENAYQRLQHIYDRVSAIAAQYHPAHLAIEAPFFGKNVQSMLKLGRAQGVAIAAAMHYNLNIAEYEPRKIKQAITGNGAASKEQVQEMLRRQLNLTPGQFTPELDASDALGAALCHYFEMRKPVVARVKGGWKEYIASHPELVRK